VISVLGVASVWFLLVLGGLLALYLWAVRP